MLQKYPTRAGSMRAGLKPKAVAAGGVFYEFAGGTACFLCPSAGQVTG